MSVAASVWCVACGGPPELTITFERHGVLAHYGACRHHATLVAARAVIHLERIDQHTGTSTTTTTTPPPRHLELDP
jgi:hypothetical protein